VCVCAVFTNQEPSENNPQQLPVQDGDEFKPNFIDDATARRLSADKRMCLFVCLMAIAVLTSSNKCGIC
jgi:hypothetical protein